MVEKGAKVKNIHIIETDGTVEIDGESFAVEEPVIELLTMISEERDRYRKALAEYWIFTNQKPAEWFLENQKVILEACGMQKEWDKREK